MSIWIFDVHLIRPGIIPGRWSDLGPARLVFLVQRGDIFHPDPHPGARRSLTTLAQIDAGPVAVHGGKELGAPFGAPEPENIAIVPEARRHALHAKNGVGMLELCLHPRERRCHLTYLRREVPRRSSTGFSRAAAYASSPRMACSGRCLPLTLTGRRVANRTMPWWRGGKLWSAQPAARRLDTTRLVR